MSPGGSQFLFGPFSETEPPKFDRSLCELESPLQIAFPARSHHDLGARSYHHRRISHAAPLGTEIVFQPFSPLCLTGNWKEHARVDRNLRPPSLRQRSLGTRAPKPPGDLANWLQGLTGYRTQIMLWVSQRTHTSCLQRLICLSEVICKIRKLRLVN